MNHFCIKIVNFTGVEMLKLIVADTNDQIIPNELAYEHEFVFRKEGIKFFVRNNGIESEVSIFKVSFSK